MILRSEIDSVEIRIVKVRGQVDLKVNKLSDLEQPVQNALP